jgi:hypothetical protein
MVDWLLLALAIPAILVPIVFLWGFGGCTFQPSAGISPPMNLMAVAGDVSLIQLAWTEASPNVQFEIERTREGQQPDAPFNIGAVNSFPDTGLEVGTKYFYRVRAVDPAQGITTDWTDAASATTFIFNGQLDPALMLGTDQPNLEGACFVTRIPAASPNPPRPWPKVKITLRGSTAGPLTIDRCTISLPADLDPTLPVDQRDAWDSLETPVMVANNVVLGAGQAQTIAVNFPVDSSLDLLVAFDINPTPGQGNVRFGPKMPAPPRSYFKLPNPPPPGGLPIVEAANKDRPGDFLPSPAIYLVDKIEVAEDV